MASSSVPKIWNILSMRVSFSILTTESRTPQRISSPSFPIALRLPINAPNPLESIKVTAHKSRKMFCPAGKPTGHKADVHGYCDFDRVEGLGKYSIGLILCDKPRFRGRAGLPFGQSVNLVVMNDQGQINVPPYRRQEMIPAFTVAAAITAFNYDFEFSVAQLCAGGDR